MANPRVAMKIGLGDESWGTITLELEPDKAPKTVENFLGYVRDGFFDGTIFHRVISHFMIQGGGYSDADTLKRGEKKPVENEAAAGLKNELGTIAMARTNDPHSATSQFFINTSNNDMLNHPGQDGWGYCAFGRVVDGMDVVDKVRDIDVEVNPMMGEKSKPVNPPQIISAEVVE